MVEFNPRTNTLEEANYQYSLQDVPEPNLYREIFKYEEIPKCAFNHTRVPYGAPNDIWITDTTFRDGQQSREPYTVEQIVTLYDLLHKLGGEKGKIRQTEFFMYSENDREAIYRCRERGYKFPEVTGWIRANKDDFQLAKSMEFEECGILVSCSDYHIFKKLKKTRGKAMEDYLNIIRQALEIGIRPRCHLEDITRADFYGFVVPFAIELRKLMDESGIPIKLRACDTLGYGLSYPGVALPRSVPGIIYGLHHYAGFDSSLIEWHGHNDFYKAVDNSTTAWLYGASGVNCALLGIGERTGNTPLEAMVIEYAQIRGTLDGMDTTVIREIADYYVNEIKYEIPPRTPYVGDAFNITQAGIHADGLLKNEEIYNIFDTVKFLNTPVGVAINEKSGLAGIAHWLNRVANTTEENAIGKHHPLVLRLKEWVDNQYTNGRVTALSDVEIKAELNRIEPRLLK